MLTSKILKFIIKLSKGGEAMKQTLRKWRRDKNLSQQELAKQAGISPRTIASWEKDNNHFRKASVGRVEAVSKVLNIHLDDFILDSNSKILKSS